MTAFGMRATTLAGLVFAALAGACAMGPPDPDAMSAGVAALEREMIRLERRGFAGQVVVAQNGDILFMAGYGTIRPGGEAPVTPDSVMPLASLTKPFTASAILALAADGALELDDPLGLHLPELGEPWNRIPIENLLTHTAGLPAEIVNRAWEGRPRFEPIDRSTLLDRIRHFPPDHPPGAGFNYSNVGYCLLGAVIEQVAGKTWEDFLRERLLLPAGIEDIGLLAPYWPPEARVHGRVRGRDLGTYFDQPRIDDGLGWLLRASGDLHGTARGIARWWQAVSGGRWLADDLLEQWLKPRATEPDGTRYGYGLHFRETPFGTVIGHTGSDQAHSVDLSWFVEAGLMVYINSAEARFQADRIREGLHRRLHGRRR